MKSIDLLPICIELTNKYPELIFWKHFSRGINGEGDIDTIAPTYLLSEISNDFVNLTIQNIPEVIAVIECRYATNVRPHFVINSQNYPNLIQFDISHNPMRLGISWCDPTKLSSFSVKNELGVRVLKPGALAIVLYGLYGLSPLGKNLLKTHDYLDFIEGIRNDQATALEFVKIVIPGEFQDLFLDLIIQISTEDWSVNLTKKIWWAFMKKSFLIHLNTGPSKCYIAYKRFRIAQNRIHHHPRTIINRSIEQYLVEFTNDYHFINMNQNITNHPF